MLKEFIIALSLTNLCFYNIILRFFYKNKFYIKDIPGAKEYVSLILAELLVTAFFWLAWRLVKKINNRYLIKFAKFFACLLVLIFIYDAARDIKSFINLDLKIFRIVFFITIIFLISKKRISKATVFFILLMAPFAGVVFFQSVQNIVMDLKKEPIPKIEQPVFAYQDNSPKILWLIFDELDYHITFVDRPKNLKMPALDDLLQQSVSAQNAYSPSKSTATSLPSLIDGKIVYTVSIANPETLRIKYLDKKEFIDWGSQPNVFSRARQLKVNTAFVGDYLPYTRLIGKDVTFCDWFQYYPRYNTPGSIGANIWRQIIMLLAGPAKHHLQRKESYYDIQNLTKKLVSDPKFGLVMIHNPIPHHPHFYQYPWWKGLSSEGYINALKLVDLTVKEIRELMEKQGTWDRTTIIISSDHSLRRGLFEKKDRRVPFIVKFAGQKNPIAYEPSFNTVITQDLVLAILRNEIYSPEKATEFLNRNGRMFDHDIIYE